MVDTVQPARLPVSETDRRRRYLKKMQLLRWNNARPKSHRARHQTSVFYGERDWKPRKYFPPPVAGEIFSLTFPFIDQAISLTTRSPHSSGCLAVNQLPTVAPDLRVRIFPPL